MDMIEAEQQDRAAASILTARQLMAERDEARAELAAIKAQAENATEYVLAQMLADARAQADALAEALGGRVCTLGHAASVNYCVHRRRGACSSCRTLAAYREKWGG